MREPRGVRATLFVASALASLLRAPLVAQTETADFCLDPGGPLTVFNDAPLRQIFVRPLPQAGCPVARPAFELGLHIANHYVDVSEGSRSAFLDAELYRLDLVAIHPIGAGREIRLEVPLQARSGGFLDGPIEFWHDLLGLPQDTRLEHPRNQSILEITDSTAARPLIDEMGDRAGLGDVTLRFLQRIGPRWERGAVALRAALKLPTGSSDDLFGSGALDAELGVAASWRPLRTIRVHTDLDLALVGDSPLADELEQSGTLASALLGLEWRPWPSLSVLAQLQGESAPLVIEISDVDRGSLVLAWGARLAFSPHVRAELAMGEDLRVRTAPDFTIRTGLRWSRP